LLGTTAHLVWWTTLREPAATEVRVVTVPSATPSPDVHVHVHPDRQRDRVARPASQASCATAARPQARRPAPASVRGAVVCSAEGCTIRRSFIQRVLHDPRLLGPAAHAMTLQPAGRWQTLRYRVIDG
jgi:hypothetical protein